MHGLAWRCGACRGRGLRVDRPRWTRGGRPPASEAGFCVVWAREAAGWIRDLARPGQGGAASLHPRPRQAPHRRPVRPRPLPCHLRAVRWDNRCRSIACRRSANGPGSAVAVRGPVCPPSARASARARCDCPAVVPDLTARGSFASKADLPGAVNRFLLRPKLRTTRSCSVSDGLAVMPPRLAVERQRQGSQTTKTGASQASQVVQTTKIGASLPSQVLRTTKTGAGQAPA